MAGKNRRQSHAADEMSGNNRNSTGLPSTKIDTLAHSKPSQHRQNRIQPQSDPILPVQIGTGTFQTLALTRLRLSAHCNPSNPAWQIQPCKSWCTGEDSNLRRSKDRQIYSLLPLTTRPPVHNHSTDEDLSVGTPSTTCFPGITQFSASGPARNTSGLSEHAPQWDHRGGQARRSKNFERRQNFLPFQAPVSAFLIVELAKGFEPPTL